MCSTFYFRWIHRISLRFQGISLSRSKCVLKILNRHTSLKTLKWEVFCKIKQKYTFRNSKFYIFDSKFSSSLLDYFVQELFNECLSKLCYVILSYIFCYIFCCVVILRICTKSAKLNNFKRTKITIWHVKTPFWCIFEISDHVFNCIFAFEWTLLVDIIISICSIWYAKYKKTPNYIYSWNHIYTGGASQVTLY